MLYCLSRNTVISGIKGKVHVSPPWETRSLNRGYMIGVWKGWRRIGHNPEETLKSEHSLSIKNPDFYYLVSNLIIIKRRNSLEPMNNFCYTHKLHQIYKEKSPIKEYIYHKIKWKDFGILGIVYIMYYYWPLDTKQYQIQLSSIFKDIGRGVTHMFKSCKKKHTSKLCCNI